QVRRDVSDHRRNDIARDGAVGLNCADQLDRGRIEQDFLLRFAQRGCDWLFAHLDAAAGESDLAGMGAKVLAPDGEDDSWLVAVGDGNQDSRFLRGVGAEFRQVPFERRLCRWPRESGTQPVGKLAHAPTPSGKKAPLLQMPGGSFASASASSASS